MSSIFHRISTVLASKSNLIYVLFKTKENLKIKQKMKRDTALGPKRHRLVPNGGFPMFEALYFGLSTISSTEFS